MRLSELLSNIPPDETLTELWPAREYTTRRKGPYITRLGLIMVALYYQGYYHREIAWILNVSNACVYSGLPNTIKKLIKVHVVDDMDRMYLPHDRNRIKQDIFKQFDDMKCTKSAAEIARKEWRTAADELEQVKEQRDMLLRYIMFRSDIDVDLCMQEESARRCPCHAHCEDTLHCRLCILANIKKLYIPDPIQEKRRKELLEFSRKAAQAKHVVAEVKTDNPEE